METKQPIWEFVANLGDALPLEYGGLFVYRDTTGVYDPEAELLVSENLEDEDAEATNWTTYRFILERCKIVRSANGYPNLVPFGYNDLWPHPIADYDEWFNRELEKLASFIGQEENELREMFCSEDPRILAEAYRAIGEYHGWENLDAYPVHWTNEEELIERYKDCKGVRI